MDKTPDATAPNDPAVFAAYVASVSGELAQLSRANGLTTLAYILEMALLEARNISFKDKKDATPRQPPMS